MASLSMIHWGGRKYLRHVLWNTKKHLLNIYPVENSGQMMDGDTHWFKTERRTEALKENTHKKLTIRKGIILHTKKSSFLFNAETL